MNRRSRRKLRTTFLGVLACGALFWGAVQLVGVPPRNLVTALGWVVLGTFVVIVCAAIPGVLLGRRRQKKS